MSTSVAYLRKRLADIGRYDLLEAAERGEISTFAAAVEVGLCKRPEALGTGSPNAAKKRNWALMKIRRFPSTARSRRNSARTTHGADSPDGSSSPTSRAHRFTCGRGYGPTRPTPGSSPRARRHSSLPSVYPFRYWAELGGLLTELSRPTIFGARRPMPIVSSRGRSQATFPFRPPSNSNLSSI